MHTDLQQRGELVLGEFSTPAEIKNQIQQTCEVLRARASKSLSDSDLNDRISTLMDFAYVLEDSIQAGCVALPQLAEFLIQFKIALKEGGVVSDESANTVARLLRAGRKVLGHEQDQLADTLSGLISYAEKNDVSTWKLLLQTLRTEM